MMRQSFLFVSLALLGAVAAQPSALTSRLIPRDLDHHKQLVQGEVTVEQTCATFSEATTVIESSCPNCDSMKIKQTIEQVQVSVTNLSVKVKSFDGKYAAEKKETIVKIFSLYVSMVNTISTYKDGHKMCKTELTQINAALVTISEEYSAKGIDLAQEFKVDPQSEEAFRKLNLSSPFANREDYPQKQVSENADEPDEVDPTNYNDDQ